MSNYPGDLSQQNRDQDSMVALLQELILEVRAMRNAIVCLVTESGKYDPEDFDPQYTEMDEQSQRQG